jgi:hypothetical protein
VAVEMIGRDVKDDRDLGMKALNGLQLEAGDLEHNPATGIGLRDQFDDRSSNVAADQDLLPPPQQDLPGKSGRCSFTVRSGDGDNAALEVTRGEFDLADDLDAELAGLGEARRIYRDAGADDDQVLVAESALAMNAGLDRNALIQQLRDQAPELGLRLGVGDGDAGAAALQEQRCCRS